MRERMNIVNMASVVSNQPKASITAVQSSKVHEVVERCPDLEAPLRLLKNFHMLPDLHALAPPTRRSR